VVVVRWVAAVAWVLEVLVLGAWACWVVVVAVVALRA
jgi:hypothetical protein